MVNNVIFLFMSTLKSVILKDHFIRARQSHRPKQDISFSEELELLVLRRLSRKLICTVSLQKTHEVSYQHFCGIVT